jgi:flagellar assembly protein FliH
MKEQMNMFSSTETFSNVFAVPVSLFEYPPTDPATSSLPKIEAREPDELVLGITLTEEAMAARMARVRAEAEQQTELRVRKEYESRDTEQIAGAVRGFERERSEYFTRVEKEIVHLALSIAGKILHRESQVDPMLVAALVKIALTQFKDGTSVTVRARPEEAGRWRDYFVAGAAQTLQVNVVEDGQIERGGCILETELGTANFSLDAQLKEVEQGFFDVLAQRP